MHHAVAITANKHEVIKACWAGLLLLCSRDKVITWLADSADCRSLLIMLYSNPHQSRDARFGGHVDYAGLLPAPPA
jgi:hypothetical protein